MAKASGLCLLVVLTAAGLLTAQTDSESKAAREKLNYFAGTWNIEMHMTTGALNSRKYVATEHNEWSTGHSLLVSKPEGDTAIPDGGLGVMGYSPSKHAYTYHILKTTGDTEDLHGTVLDRTWTWQSDELQTGSEATRTRITMKETSPIAYTLRVEIFAPTGEWVTVMEGTAKKVFMHAHQDVAFLR
jgi:hypothetical protein